MSRPPIATEATPAGIISKTTGDRVVAASRRPDGSLRKELKIRPGYTPDEDVKRYRAIRAAEAEARSTPKSRIPGLPVAPSVQSAVSGMTNSQKKTEARKDKRKDESLDPVPIEVTETPDTWDSDESEKKPHKTSLVEEASPKSAGSDEKPAAEAKPPSSVEEDLKHIRAVKKKIRQADLLRQREISGLYLPPAERAKVKQIPDLEAELAKMTLSEDKTSSQASPP